MFRSKGNRNVNRDSRQQHDGANPVRARQIRNVTYRRIGGGIRRPLLCLQHFTGTLDNWDWAVTDPLASDREVILFENAGVGRSTGTVPSTVSGMATHALDFLDALCLSSCDVLGFSLGGMVAQQMALDRPSIDPSDDSGRHCAARRRRHHAPRETEPGQAPR